MSVPEFSIITPTYNCCRFIRRCYWSLCQQTLQNWEWIVVDDASTDGTDELLRELNDPRIRYFRNAQTQGPGIARNLAMQQARGSWLVIQDMDDFSFPDRLEKARAARDQGYEYMSSYLALIDGQYAWKGLRGWQTTKYPYSFPHGTLCGQTELLRRIGYPSYRRGEDQTIVLRLANKHRGMHVPEPLYLYHENASAKARKAMLGHYCVVQQLRDLVRTGVLSSSLGVYRIMVLSIIKMSVLALFFLRPELYEKTLRWRERIRTSNAKSLTDEQSEFIRQVAARFPMAVKVK